MGRLIDADAVKEKYPLMENKYGMIINEGLHKAIDSMPAVQAIPRADYENRLKADMVAMLKELQSEIEEIDSRAGYDGNGMPTFANDYVRIIKVNEIIQQKISSLKEN